MKMAKISKEVLNKLARKAGVKSLSGLTYEEIIGTVLVMIQKILRNCILISNNRKTITLDDIKYSFDFLGHKLYTYDEDISKCKTFTKKTKVKNKYLKQIKYYQNQADCVYIPKASFKKIVKNELNNFQYDLPDDLQYTKNIKISNIALDHFQFAIESLCIELLEKANRLAITHAKRITLQPKDIAAVRYILSNSDPLLGS